VGSCYANYNSYDHNHHISVNRRKWACRIHSQAFEGWL